MISWLDALALLGAGVLAGAVGTAGAITSLVSYPALLLVGLSPRTAGVANVVAATASWPGAALTSTRELAGHGRWLGRRLPAAALGGASGTALLLSTSPAAFDRIVPFLVAIGAVSLLATPRLTARRRRASDPPARAERWSAPLVLGLSIYNGYFGAGSGVMLLATCLVALDDGLPAANAVKNMLVGMGSLAATVGLAAFGHVDWRAVGPLAAGVLVGGALGPLLARRVPERVLRPLVACVGLGLAVQLFVSGGG